MYGVFLVSLPICILVVFVEEAGVTVAFLPTAYMAILAVYYIVAPHCVRVDPRGREHDFTPRKVAVVMNGGDGGAALASICASQSSDVVQVSGLSPGRRPGFAARTLPGYRRDSFRDTPGEIAEGDDSTVGGDPDLLREMIVREFDFVLYTTAATRWPPGALHRMSNVAMANRGVAAVVAATPWDWRPGAESTWGKVQHLPAEGTMITVRHPALRSADLTCPPSARAVGSYSRHTLMVEDSSTVVRWGFKPPTNLIEHMEYYTAGARFFCLVYLPMYGEGPWRWAPWSLYGSLFLAHVVRLLMCSPKKVASPGPGQESDLESGNPLHGHQFAT